MCRGRAPRSADADSSDPPIRRNRAVTLLKMTTMQKVAWPTMIVKRPALMPKTGLSTFWMTDCSAIPVTMPGSAMGRIDQQRDRVAPEEPVAGQRQREQACPARGRSRSLRVPPRPTSGGRRGARRFERGGPPLRGEAGRRPAERPVGVERVDRDHGQRDVDEREHQRRRRPRTMPARRVPRSSSTAHRLSRAPVRRMASR